MQLSTPDARNTLLWQPSIDTDEKGEATISFYCSDINTEFIGVVEGTDERDCLEQESVSLGWLGILIKSNRVIQPSNPFFIEDVEPSKQLLYGVT